MTAVHDYYVNLLKTARESSHFVFFVRKSINKTRRNNERKGEEGLDFLLDDRRFQGDNARELFAHEEFD